MCWLYVLGGIVAFIAVLGIALEFLSERIPNMKVRFTHLSFAIYLPALHLISVTFNISLAAFPP